MQVFKTFMKILKTRLTSAILYLVIFMVIAVIMADTAKDNNDYEDYKMSISVIDRDNKQAFAGLYIQRQQKGGACR